MILDLKHVCDRWQYESLHIWRQTYDIWDLFNLIYYLKCAGTKIIVWLYYIDFMV